MAISGDVVRGAKAMVEAVRCSKAVADAMCACTQSPSRA